MAEWQYHPGSNGRLPIDRGFGVRHHNVNAEQKGASARLYNQEGDYISLWVNEVEAAFELNGQAAQSVKHREFYAHNFSQPQLTVRGQTANNYEYNRLSEFIRHTHKRAVMYAQHKLDNPAIVLQLFPGGRDTRRGTKGRHRGLVLEGFVPMFERGAKRFQFAHEFEFNFVVTKSVKGLMEDQAYTARKLLSWADMVIKPDNQALARVGKSDFVEDPDDPGYVTRLLTYAEDNNHRAGLGLGALDYPVTNGLGPK